MSTDLRWAGASEMSVRLGSFVLFLLFLHPAACSERDDFGMTIVQYQHPIKSQQAAYMSRVSSVIEALKNLTDDVILVLNTGGTRNAGSVSVSKHPTVRPHATTFSVHDFSGGLSGLMSRLVLSSDLFVATNIQSPLLQRFVAPSFVFAHRGRKVAVLGFVSPHLNAMLPRGKSTDTLFLKEQEVLRVAIEKLKRAGVNIVVALGNSGYEQNKLVASDVEGLDVVVAPPRVSNTHINTSFPIMIDQTVSDAVVPLLEVPGYTEHTMAVTRLRFDGLGRVTDLHGDHYGDIADRSIDSLTGEVIEKAFPESQHHPLLMEASADQDEKDRPDGGEENDDVAHDADPVLENTINTDNVVNTIEVKSDSAGSSGIDTVDESDNPVISKQANRSPSSVPEEADIQLAQTDHRVNGTLQSGSPQSQETTRHPDVVPPPTLGDQKVSDEEEEFDELIEMVLDNSVEMLDSAASIQQQAIVSLKEDQRQKDDTNSIVSLKEDQRQKDDTNSIVSLNDDQRQSVDADDLIGAIISIRDQVMNEEAERNSLQQENELDEVLAEKGSMISEVASTESADSSLEGSMNEEAEGSDDKQSTTNEPGSSSTATMQLLEQGNPFVTSEGAGAEEDLEDQQAIASSPYADAIITVAPVRISGDQEQCSRVQCDLGVLLAQAVKEQLPLLDADTIRTDIVLVGHKTFDGSLNGNIGRSSLDDVIEKDYQILQANISGDQLIMLMETKLYKDREMLHVAGLDVSVFPPLQLVLNASLLCDQCDPPIQPLQQDGSYSVTLVSGMFTQPRQMANARKIDVSLTDILTSYATGRELLTVPSTSGGVREMDMEALVEAGAAGDVENVQHADLMASLVLNAVETLLPVPPHPDHVDILQDESQMLSEDTSEPSQPQESSQTTDADPGEEEQQPNRLVDDDAEVAAVLGDGTNDRTVNSSGLVEDAVEDSTSSTEQDQGSDLDLPYDASIEFILKQGDLEELEDATEADATVENTTNPSTTNPSTIDQQLQDSNSSQTGNASNDSFNSPLVDLEKLVDIPPEEDDVKEEVVRADEDAAVPQRPVKATDGVAAQLSEAPGAAVTDWSSSWSSWPLWILLALIGLPFILLAGPVAFPLLLG